MFYNVTVKLRQTHEYMPGVCFFNQRSPSRGPVTQKHWRSTQQSLWLLDEQVLICAITLTYIQWPISAVSRAEGPPTLSSQFLRASLQWPLELHFQITGQRSLRWSCVSLSRAFLRAPTVHYNGQLFLVHSDAESLTAFFHRSFRVYSCAATDIFGTIKSLLYMHRIQCYQFTYTFWNSTMRTWWINI